MDVQIDAQFPETDVIENPPVVQFRRFVLMQIQWIGGGVADPSRESADAQFVHMIYESVLLQCPDSSRNMIVGKMRHERFQSIQRLALVDGEGRSSMFVCYHRNI